MSGTATRAESPEDFGQNPRGVAARWIAEIRLAEQSMQRFWDRGARIEARYLDERREVDRGASTSSGATFRRSSRPCMPSRRSRLCSAGIWTPTR
jgi:hypothetical protein